MNRAQALFKALTEGAVVALVLATATPSWPEDGSRDWLTQAAQDAGAMPAYHLGGGRFDDNLGRADVRIDDLSGVPFAQAGGASGAAGGSTMGGDSGQASLAEIGHKLTDPVSDVWALSTEFDLTSSDGHVNRATRRSAAG